MTFRLNTIDASGDFQRGDCKGMIRTAYDLHIRWPMRVFGWPSTLHLSFPYLHSVSRWYSWPISAGAVLNQGQLIRGGDSNIVSFARHCDTVWREKSLLSSEDSLLSTSSHFTILALPHRRC